MQLYKQRSSVYDKSFHFVQITLEKMKTYSLKYLIALILLLGGYQTQYAQWTCATPDPSSDFLDDIGVIGYGGTMTGKTIQVFIHVVANSSGIGGLSQTQIDNAMLELETAYEPANICFEIIGSDRINNSQYVPFSGSQFSNLMGENPHSNAIDIYLLPQGNWGGRADGIPGIAFAIDGNLAETPVMAHEMGHCLGAYHTHSGRGCGDNANCQEAVNGSNCTDCGDRVCDTPADPCLSGLINSSCNYTGSSTFSPDLTNIMSYTRPTCMDHLTMGQFDRIHTVIDNSSMLQATLSKNPCGRVDAPCQPIWVLPTPPAFPKIEASNYISASCYLAPGSDHTFDAANYIHLTPGFRAAKNSEFHAYIDGCGNLRQGTVAPQLEIATEFSVYPNPSSNKTTFAISLGQESSLSLRIMDMNGRIVANPISNKLSPAGEEKLTFPVKDLPNGVYICELRTGDQILTKKLVVQH